MSADLTKPFAPSCCEGGGCSDNKQSAQPCGCDKGADWICEVHKAELAIQEAFDRAERIFDPTP